MPSKPKGKGKKELSDGEKFAAVQAAKKREEEEKKK